MPIPWGKADPPPHPDEGIEWSRTSDRADRVEWELRQAASGSQCSLIAVTDIPSATCKERRMRIQWPSTQSMFLLVPEMKRDILPQMGSKKDCRRMGAEQGSSSTQSGEQMDSAARP
jgi:hypothetical protein